MSNLTKRGLALLLVLATLVCMIATVGVNASAADFSYEYSGKYIYNWGERGEVATFLSPNAKSFYEDNNTSYDILSSYSGGTSQSNASSSKLYSELKSLMSGAHSHITSYNETKDLYRYTDCQNNGGKISSFYSGTLIGPAWGEGSWNREHTWPNSKGLGGSDENDIMMLRPTSTSENSSRGNTAYGKSSGYYNPNSESGGKYDLRGDVARIFLYVYVRWGNTSYAWGKSGVMESVDVLLEWMEADPVDTWELGRNDSVESITGTRNVFVDYPELGFILFGAEIPMDMTTPSGDNKKDCGHNNLDGGVIIAATCTEKGYTLYTCQTAGCTYSYKGNNTDAKGHSYASVVTAPTCSKGGYTTFTCTVCKFSYVGNNTAAVAHNYVNDKCTLCGTEKGSMAEGTISFSDTANRTVFNTSQQVWVQNGITVTNDKAASSSSVANYYNPARFYASSSLTIKAEGNITKIVFDCNTASYANTLKESIGSSATVSSDKVTVTLSGNSDTFKVAKLNAQVRVDSITVTCEPAVPSCSHANKIAIGTAIAPTCTTTGLTEGQKCADCGVILVAQATTAALGHSYDTVVIAPDCINGGYTTYTCSVCSDSYVVNTSALGHINSQPTLENIVNATCTESGEYDTVVYCSVCNIEISREHIVVSPNGHTYNTTVTAPDCTNGGYTTYTCSVCGDSYVVNIPALGHNYDAVITAPDCINGGYTTYTCNCGDSYVGDYTTALGHTTVSDTELAPTCTTTGLTYGAHCSACGEVLVAQEIVDALGHNYDAIVTAPDCTNGGYTTYTCSTCGDSYVADEVAALGHTEVIDEVVDPTCSEAGYTTYTCSTCGDTYAADEVDALGHTEVIDAEVAPTCIATGLTKGKHCSICNEVLLAQETVSALGHSYDAVVTAPDCINGGYTTYTCSVCDDTYVDNYTTALGHYYDVAIVAPTCTADGYITHTCVVCNDVYVEAELSTTGHEWKDATTESPKTCEKCGETEGEKLPAPEVEINHDECEQNANAWSRFLTNIANFFRRLFSLNVKCYCGEEIDL